MIIVGLILLEASGCKHLQQKKEQQWPLLVPPAQAEVKEEKGQKTVNITLLKIDNFTIKAF